MPSAVVKMQIENLSPSSYQNVVNKIQALQHNAKLSTKPKNFALGAPMIGRIFDAKPGCGSCGK